MARFARSSSIHISPGGARRSGSDGDDHSFPSDQVSNLRRRRQALSSELSPRPCTISVIPTTCGIFRNLELIGVFPTSRWLNCPTMHADVKELFGGSPFHGLGEYRVSHVELHDGAGTLHDLVLIVNTGVRGMDVGHFGGIYKRTIAQQHPDRVEQIECIAQLQQSRVFEVHRFQLYNQLKFNTEQSIQENGKLSEKSRWFVPFPEWLEFLTTKSEATVGTPSCLPKTQLEQLLEIASEFIVESVDWDSMLHPSLIEVRDMSPRVERRRARGRCRVQPIRLSFDEASNEPPDCAATSEDDT